MTDPSLMANYADSGDCHKSRRSQPTFKELVTVENLLFAYQCAAKEKKYRPGVRQFSKDLGLNIHRLYGELLAGTYRPKSCRQFEIFCTSGQKKRLISAPAFRDTVVQHLLYQAFYPVFDRGFIFDSYGCRREKGTHRAADRVQSFMRKSPEDSCYLQMDVRRYYYTIRHDVLKRAIERVVADPKIVDLFMAFAGDNKIGLQVGCLVSQLFGMIYLDRFDHYMKRVLKVKRYVRYVDDIVIVGVPREEAKTIKAKVEAYLLSELGLTLSKWKIQKLERGINFVGFRTWRHKRLVRKRSLHSFSRALRKRNLRSIEAIIGHAERTSTHGYYLSRLLDEFDIDEILSLSDRLRAHLGRHVFDLRP